MSVAIVLLRILSLLAFGGPAIMGATGPRPPDTDKTAQATRLPLVANLSSFGLFFPLLLITREDFDGHVSLELAIGGAAFSVIGSLIALRSRRELGAAWSLAPRAGEASGLVTTGPYRRVRHPIYSGLSMLTAGEAIAFASLPAFLVAVIAVVPTFLWRAHVEEQLLIEVFGAKYLDYRMRTKTLIPFLL